MTDNTSSSELKLRFFNNEYSLRSDLPPEQAQKVVSLVEERMRTTSAHFKGLVTADKAAVLVAVNLAEELLAAHHDLEQTSALVQERLTALLALTTPPSPPSSETLTAPKP